MEKEPRGKTLNRGSSECTSNRQFIEIELPVLLFCCAYVAKLSSRWYIRNN